MSQAILDAALQQARQGRRVLPCHSIRNGICTCGSRTCAKPGKHACIKGWPERATTDPETIKQWWAQFPHANVAIATGRASGIVVLDVDGPRGFELLEKMGNLPQTRVVGTPSGGVHMWFLAPEQPLTTRTRFRPDLDLRAEGGYAVVPPSIHARGVYEWIHNGSVAEPPFLMEILESQTGGGIFSGAATAKQGFKIPDIIEQGQRNDILFRLACKLRAMGRTKEQATSEVLRICLERCEQPPGDVFGHDECAGVVDSAWRYDGPDLDAEGFIRKYDEAGLVDRIWHELDHPEADALLDLGQAWSWDGQCWRPFGDHGVGDMLWQWKDEVYTRASDGKVMSFRPKHNLLKNVHGLMLKSRKASTGFFSEAPPAAAFANGTLLPDGSMIGHSPWYRLTHLRTHSYVPDTECHRFMALMRKTFRADDVKQRILAFQEFAGAVLFGVGPQYQRAMVLVGDGQEGKSQVIEVIKALVPPSARSVIAPHDLGVHHIRAELAGAMLNVVTEVDKKELYTSEAIKASISGEEMQGVRKWGHPFIFRPRAAHLFACNELPATSDFSRGFRRRWIIIECTNIVRRKERIIDYGKEIAREELDGVIAWAAEGAQRLMSQKEYTEVPSSVAAMEQWRRDSDQVAEFADEMLEERPGARTRLIDIYNSYQVWMSMAGRGRLSKNKMSRRLTRLGFKRGRDGKGIFFEVTIKRMT